MEPAGVGWARLPQDLLVTVFSELPIPDLLRSSAVCTSWHAACSAFRRLRLPSPRQPPCLLYSSHAYGPGAAALCCASTGAAFRVPVVGRLRSLSLVGSAHGWLVVADEASNLHLLNPLTGDRLALPPVTAMHLVEGSVDGGGLVYDVREGPGDPFPARFAAREARDYMYDRAVLSCSPSAGGGGACVVLLLHMPDGELSFARPGDERWTPVSPPDGLTGHRRRRKRYRDAVYSSSDGLFYLVSADESVHTLDPSSPSPVATKVMQDLGRREVGDKHSNNTSRYLVQTPWGDLLQAWRFREEAQSGTPVELPPSAEDEEEFNNPLLEVNTTELQIYKVDFHGQKLLRVASLRDHALFLGYNGSLCLAVKDYPGLKPNCAYFTDDLPEYVNFYKYNRREIGVWSIETQSLQSLGGATTLKAPWLNWPAPIWITPSLI